MAAPLGQVQLPRLDMGGLPEESTLHHGMAAWDRTGTYLFLVPLGVTRLLIDLVGAQSGSRCLHWVDVPPGALLTVVIGDGGPAPGASGDNTCTGLGFALTAGAAGLIAVARDASGGNVLSPIGNVGYCLIQW